MVAKILMIVMGLIVSRSWAAPIATNTALPVSANEIILRGQLVATRSSDHLDGMNRQLDRVELRTVLGYGLTSKWAVFGVLPLVKSDRTIGDVNASAFGLGDAVLFARYEVFRSDKPGRTVRIAPYGGVRVPSGRDDKISDGSVDVIGGLIATVASTQWVLDSQFRFDRSRESGGFKRGNSTGIESSYQYRLSPGKVTRDTNAFVFGVLEISANYHERNRVNGVMDPNSGGFQLYLTPGVQYATRRWIADFGFKVPIVNDLNGSALEPGYSILASVRVNF